MNKVLNENSKILDSKFNKYDVSVCIITYNKEKYISDAIESVLMQETSVSYEIVVGDNASSDYTPSILKSYWEKYPQIFSIILNNDNLGLTTNMYNTMQKAKGKYIIILYGDDYWLSNDKLQKQYEFLEKNKQYVGVSSAIEFRYDGEDSGFKKLPIKKLRNKDFTLDTYLQGFDFPMAGVMFRNSLFTSETKHFHKMIEASLSIDDLSFCILLLMKGKIFVLEDAMGAYRCFKKDSKSTNFNSVNSKTKIQLMSIELLNILDKETENTLNLETRYGLILASSWFAFMKREVTFSDYKKIVKSVSDLHRDKHKRMLLLGIARKLSLLQI